MSSLSFCPYQKDKRAKPGNLIKLRSFPLQKKILSLLAQNFLFAPTLLLSFLILSSFVPQRVQFLAFDLYISQISYIHKANNFMTAVTSFMVLRLAL
jgi:hypothetical protein